MKTLQALKNQQVVSQMVGKTSVGLLVFLTLSLFLCRECKFWRGSAARLVFSPIRWRLRYVEGVCRRELLSDHLAQIAKTEGAVLRNAADVRREHEADDEEKEEKLHRLVSRFTDS